MINSNPKNVDKARRTINKSFMMRLFLEKEFRERIFPHSECVNLKMKTVSEWMDHIVSTTNAERLIYCANMIEIGFSKVDFKFDDIGDLKLSLEKFDN